MESSPIAWSPHYPMRYLASIDLVDTDIGVYVIWRMTREGREVLDVGSGIIRDRIEAHLREHPDWKDDAAFVWSPIPYQPDTKGIEAYLADRFRLRSANDRRFPNVARVSVVDPFSRPW